MEIKTNEDKRSAQVSIHTRWDQVTVRTVDIYYDENGDIQTDTDRFEVVDDQQLQIIMDKLEQRYVELEENYDERACAMEEEQREHRVKQAENAAKLVEQDRSEAEEILDDFA